VSLQTAIIPFQGWARNLRLGNGTVELIVTLEVGPRILSYSLPGGTNPFKIFEDQVGGTGEPNWRNRGGHRLWLAPESPTFSYVPDNSPVRWEPLGAWGVRLIPPPETASGFQKELDVTLSPSGTKVRVVHRLTRLGDTPHAVAPWALTVMAAGGWAILPQPPFGEHPRDLLPNRRLILWPYTDLSDPRFRFGRKFFTVRQDSASGPTKLGFAQQPGWGAYFLRDTLFVKKFPWQSAAAYPDDGCNLEVFTNARMLELESLGPLVTLPPGGSLEHIEEWELKGGLSCDPGSDEALEALLRPLVEKTAPRA